MIPDYLQTLSQSFKPRQAIDSKPLLPLWQRRDLIGMVRFIKNSLDLKKLKVTLGKVKDGGPEKAAAWIGYPNPIPMYGSSEFSEMSVTLFIRNKIIQNSSFELLVSAIAHELCHIVLNSIGHPLKESEKATDLTAMILGYHDFFLQGYGEGKSILKTESENVTEYVYRIAELVTGTRYERSEEYLSTSEVRFAHEWIRTRL